MTEALLSSKTLRFLVRSAPRWVISHARAYWSATTLLASTLGMSLIVATLDIAMGRELLSDGARTCAMLFARV